MSDIKYLIYGAGAHARVIAEALYVSENCLIGVFDEKFPEFLPDYIHYLGSYSPTIHPEIKIIFGIGNNLIREQHLSKIKHDFFSFIHPSSKLASSVSIDNGSVILQNVVIQNNSKIGKHCIINASSVIDHDVVISDFVQISPLVYIGSNSIITNLQLVPPITRIDRFTTF